MNRRTLIKAGAASLALSCLLGAGTAFAENVTLRMSTWLPPKHHVVTDALPTWIKAVSDASGGTLTIKIDPAPIGFAFKLADASDRTAPSFWWMYWR